MKLVAALREQPWEPWLLLDICGGEASKTKLKGNGGFKMKHILLVLLGILVMHLITGCGEGNAPVDDNATNEPTNQNADLNTDTSTALVNGFCAAQTQLQIVSTGLLSAYSVKGNGSDLNYCGGEIILTEDNPDFAISINDYCFNFRNQQLTLNGDIIGAIESGANFTSQIQALSVVGDAVDLSISGRTWDGRADDMFISITVHDNLADEALILEDVSIKKGELDFGYVTFSDLGRFEFKFIEHFNAELTQGQLFLYGKGEELVIVTADNGAISVVYKESKADPGTPLDSNCSG
ncbi:MAG: hypothetical protein LJE85_14240 [Gammaproteobacteria bacterium]|nr:hypothetical protein [Gammaproteobacteria bacterium]